MVYVLLADGFEEAEAIVPADLWHRAGLSICLVGINSKTVTGSHGFVLNTDKLIGEIDPLTAALVFLPGGGKGTEALYESRAVRDLLNNLPDRCIIAAICAAPSVLGRLGMLDGIKATCYPGFEDRMGKAIYQPDQSVVDDGRFVTGKAMGVSLEFGLAVIEKMLSKEAAQNIASAVYYNSPSVL